MNTYKVTFDRIDSSSGDQLVKTITADKYKFESDHNAYIFYINDMKFAEVIYEHILLIEVIEE
jgi:hypothetical protein